MSREKAVKFGRSASLVGVVTEPPAPATGQPAVLLLNSGVLHRVGSCRLHVRIARELAPAGFTVLRFDYSGIGDSEPRRDQLSFEESAPLETQEAMDYLAATKGAREFVLIGLCSGADMAHHVAARDPRVVGMVLLDAWAFRTVGFYLRHALRHYGSRIHRASVWVSWVRRQLGRMAHRRARAESAGIDGVTFEIPRYIREVPPRARVAADLRAFAQRGMQLFYIFTGGQADRYNHRAQHERTFRGIDFGGRMRVEYLPDADHILTGLRHQRYVVSETRRWMERFAASHPRDDAAAPGISLQTPSALPSRSAAARV